MATPLLLTVPQTESPKTTAALYWCGGCLAVRHTGPSTGVTIKRANRQTNIVVAYTAFSNSVER